MLINALDENTKTLLMTFWAFCRLRLLIYSEPSNLIQTLLYRVDGHDSRPGGLHGLDDPPLLGERH